MTELKTTPEAIRLADNLDIKAGVMEMGERIAWGSDTALMRQAADNLRKQHARIAELEAAGGDEMPTWEWANGFKVVKYADAAAAINRRDERIAELEAAAMLEAGIVREGQFSERNVADIIFDAATRYANGYLVNFDDVTREVQATLSPCLHQIAEPAVTAEYAQAAWDAALNNYEEKS